MSRLSHRWWILHFQPIAICMLLSIMICTTSRLLLSVVIFTTLHTIVAMIIFIVILCTTLAIMIIVQWCPWSLSPARIQFQISVMIIIINLRTLLAMVINITILRTRLSVVTILRLVEQSSTMLIISTQVIHTIIEYTRMLKCKIRTVENVTSSTTFCTWTKLAFYY